MRFFFCYWAFLVQILYFLRKLVCLVSKTPALLIVKFGLHENLHPTHTTYRRNHLVWEVNGLEKTIYIRMRNRVRSGIQGPVYLSGYRSNYR